MRILIVGSIHPAALERTYNRHFQELGVESELFDSRQPVGWIHALPQKGVNGLRRFFPASGLGALNTLLREKVRNWGPDVVWVFKGMEILPATLRHLRKEVPLLANYNPDHPFQFTGPGSGNALMARSLRFYHTHLTYQEAIADRVRSELGLPAACIPFGFDLNETSFLSLPPLREILHIGFVGTADANRVTAIRRLLEAGLPVDVYGNGWEKHLHQAPELRIFGPVYGMAFWEILRAYRVQLNLFRPHNNDSHNMRSFDIPGAGGIQLAPYSLELSLFFEPDREIFLFGSPQEMVQKARQLLALSTEEAGALRIAARNRSEQGGYHYRDRAGEVIAFFRKCLGKH